MDLKGSIGLIVKWLPHEKWFVRVGGHFVREGEGYVLKR